MSKIKKEEKKIDMYAILYSMCTKMNIEKRIKKKKLCANEKYKYIYIYMWIYIYITHTANELHTENTENTLCVCLTKKTSYRIAQ